MKYIYSTSQMSKLSLTLYTFSITGSVAGLFLTKLLNSDHHMLLLSGYSRHLKIDTEMLSSFFEYLICFIYLESAPDNF